MVEHIVQTQGAKLINAQVLVPPHVRRALSSFVRVNRPALDANVVQAE